MLKILFLFLSWLCSFKFMGLIEIKEFAGSDLSFNDLYYKVLRVSGASNQESSNNVIMVNSGSLSRDSFRLKLAQLISKVEQYNPKVIGVDHNFSNDTTILGTNELRRACSRFSNKLVLGRNSLSRKGDFLEFDSSIYGVVNFPEEEGQISVRRYSESTNSFANQMRKIGTATRLDFEKVSGIDKDDESSSFVINYVYNHDGNGIYDFKDNFFTNLEKPEDGVLLLEGQDLFDENKLDAKNIENLISNNYVIIGHMGPYGFVDKSFDMEDKFRVPCDTNLINRDRVMYGSVIHANALANLLKSDLQFTDVERTTVFLILKELIFLMFIYYLLFLNLGKMGTITILAMGSFGIIYLTLFLMQKGIYLEIGGSLLELLVIEEAFESVEPLLHKFHKWISTKKTLTFLTVLFLILSNPAKGQSIQLAVKKGSITLNNLTYKQGASLSISYSSSLNVSPNSVVLAKNDQNKVIQLPSGELSGKKIKTLFKNSQNYNESVVHVMFNTTVHAVHQAGITTRGSKRTLQFCPADSSIILQDTLPFFIRISDPPPKIGRAHV